jgi:hypothetical protein
MSQVLSYDTDAHAGFGWTDVTNSINSIQKFT